MGRQIQGTDRPGVRQAQEGNGEQRKMEVTGCEIICGASKTLAVKGWRMMVLVIINSIPSSVSLLLFFFLLFRCGFTNH